mmetsp:Transcript_8206/g.19646  ORF Transcript_8206/g.19646 Transcript_8206/m.19646 type:complete len:319 (+) Transcript_8206:785-1741(+)
MNLQLGNIPTRSLKLFLEHPHLREFLSARAGRNLVLLGVSLPQLSYHHTLCGQLLFQTVGCSMRLVQFHPVLTGQAPKQSSGRLFSLHLNLNLPRLGLSCFLLLCPRGHFSLQSSLKTLLKVPRDFAVIFWRFRLTRGVSHLCLLLQLRHTLRHIPDLLGSSRRKVALGIQLFPGQPKVFLQTRRVSLRLGQLRLQAHQLLLRLPQLHPRVRELSLAELQLVVDAVALRGGSSKLCLQAVDFLGGLGELLGESLVVCCQRRDLICQVLHGIVQTPGLLRRCSLRCSRLLRRLGELLALFHEHPLPPTGLLQLKPQLAA